jgi:7-cyano-7-deazaguanine synthase in queuosine biosynthesis
MNLKLSTALMRTAVGRIGHQHIAQSLTQTTQSLMEICDPSKRRSMLVRLARGVRLGSANLDGWTLPDAVWTELCLQQTSLSRYPLGEIAERAVKQAMLLQIVPGVTHKSIGTSHGSLLSSIRLGTRRFRQSTLLRDFLACYFFDLCVDYLRRPGILCRGYNFSKKGEMISLVAEHKLRATLAAQSAMWANRILPFLQRARRRKNPADGIGLVGEVLQELFGVAPPGKERSQDCDPRDVNVIVGTRSSALIRETHTVDKNTHRFLLHDPRPNVTASFETLDEFLQRPPHSRVKDLIDLGVTVYMSDLYTKREHNLGRRLGIFMPLRDCDSWSDAQKEVERAVAYLGRDDVQFHFVKRKEQKSPRKFTVKPDKRCVCLLSGGLDSLAGAVWAIENGLTPIFVSHSAGGQLTHLQKSLVEKLGKKYRRTFQHLHFYVAKSMSRKARYPLSAPPHTLMVQHLRSFLFLALASAVALERKIDRIYVFENGPLALNPLISEGRVNTHTAHPHFLGLFQKMIHKVFGVELHIRNPFRYMTKGEVAAVLTSPKLGSLVKSSNSCWNWFKVPVIAKNMGVRWDGQSHDGLCLPCILRRVSMDRAGIAKSDASYLIDSFTAFPRKGTHDDALMALADLLRFCQNVRSLSDAELLLYAPEFSVYEERIDAEELSRMYREQAEEVQRCFQKRLQRQVSQALAPALF